MTGAPRPPAGEGPSSPRPGRRRLPGAAAGWARPRPRRAGADAGLGTEGRCAPFPGLGERLRQGAARGTVTSPQGQVAGAWGAGRASAARSCRGWGAGRALAGSRSCGPGSAPLHPWTSGRGRSASPPAEPDGGLVAPPRGRRRELPSRCLRPGAVTAGPGAGAAQSPPRWSPHSGAARANAQRPGGRDRDVPKPTQARRALRAHERRPTCPADCRWLVRPPYPRQEAGHMPRGCSGRHCLAESGVRTPRGQ